MLFILTHNYTGYPMVRHARELVAGGELGQIRVVQVEYAQDWLTEAVEQTGRQAAVWRTPIQNSQASRWRLAAISGTTAFNLASHTSTGLTLDGLAADLDSLSRDGGSSGNGLMLLRFAGGAKGMLWCSQVAPGNENALKLRVCWVASNGSRANYLWFTPFGEQNGSSPATAPGQARRRRQDQPHSRRPSGRLSRSLRDDLHGGCRGDQCRQGRSAARSGGHHPTIDDFASRRGLHPGTFSPRSRMATG